MLKDDLVNKKFGYLIAKYPILKRYAGKNRVFWFCRCVSGLEGCIGEKEVLREKLLNGNTKSCGCLQKTTQIKPTHGHYNTKTWEAWSQIRKRCNNPNHKQYKYYGGRGIRVCKQWSGEKGFINFLNDMGYAPEGMSIDRIDNNGNYEKSNCRWANMTQQNRNRQNTLNEIKVKKIKNLLKNGTRGVDIARIYRVHPTTIYAIKNNINWKGVE